MAWISPVDFWLMPLPAPPPLAISVTPVAVVPVVWIVPAFCAMDTPAVSATLPFAAWMEPAVCVIEPPAPIVIPPGPAAVRPEWVTSPAVAVSVTPPAVAPVALTVPDWTRLPVVVLSAATPEAPDSVVVPLCVSPVAAFSVAAVTAVNTPACVSVPLLAVIVAPLVPALIEPVLLTDDPVRLALPAVTVPATIRLALFRMVALLPPSTVPETVSALPLFSTKLVAAKSASVAT